MALSDIEIARSVKFEDIAKIAEKVGIDERYIERYGRYKAKVDLSILKTVPNRRGKLILVTAVTPTPAGEGKTTVSIGLADGMRRLGLNAVAALREPSLGPVFGLKGGATGGGRAQVVPMEDINLHFNGDFHAVSAANNLLAAMLDNHIKQGNALGIDPATVSFKRAVDMDDRQLRFIVSGLGGRAHGVPREDGFDITAASEVMAAWCMASDLNDLKERFSRIVVGYAYDRKPVTAGDLKAAGAMAALMLGAMNPNLVQTLEGTPVFIHGGPFANIAHGCNSVAATRLALSLGDYVITEAGFGADLGAEKFIDIKCRAAGFKPDACVIVATVRALKMHGGAAKIELDKEDLKALEKGMKNLLRHIDNMKNVYGLPVAVALNAFTADTAAEKDMVVKECAKVGVKAVETDVWAKGGAGAEELAREAVKLTESPNAFRFAYESDVPVEEKIEAVVRKVYRGSGAEILPAAKAKLLRFKELGYGSLPVCIAKTQYSFSDDPKKIGAPENFKITVRDVRLSAGAGFIVALTGEIITMPGLPASPAACNIDVAVDADGVARITGLS